MCTHLQLFHQLIWMFANVERRGWREAKLLRGKTVTNWKEYSLRSMALHRDEPCEYSKHFVGPIQADTLLGSRMQMARHEYDSQLAEIQQPICFLVRIQLTHTA